MEYALNATLMLILVTNLFTVGTSRIESIIRTMALQGILLGVLPLLMHEHFTVMSILAAFVAIALKGFVIPTMMHTALREANIKREVEPLIGLLPSLLLGAGATILALILAPYMPLLASGPTDLIFATSLATIFTGFLLLTTRFKALTQVIGYLILENGIFIFGVLLIEAMPVVIELGVLLDLFVGIFVSCIIVGKINKSFSSMDTRNLSMLRE